ncbi:hypothetical protein [Pseudoduganella sp. GCM10020061]|uniref:hypothetical protein n=1 Tax=Pseudoduganella sp. GCM10020061 TaxID=3317345 RepID=UPI00362F43B6
MALKTRRAFDEHTAQRFVELSGIPDALARNVLARPPGQTRSELIMSPSPDDARRKRPRAPGEAGFGKDLQRSEGQFGPEGGRRRQNATSA